MADARRSNFELEKRTGLREVEVERNRLTSLQPNENISFDRAIQQLQEVKEIHYEEEGRHHG